LQQTSSQLVIQPFTFFSDMPSNIQKRLLFLQGKTQAHPSQKMDFQKMDLPQSIVAGPLLPMTLIKLLINRVLPVEEALLMEDQLQM
jgi:hypothetical protein